MIDRYIRQYGWAVASAGHTCTVYITVLVAVHRYVYVCCPHSAKRLSTLRRAKIHAAVVPVFALCYSLPRVFEYQVHDPMSNFTSQTADSLLAQHDPTCDDLLKSRELNLTEIGRNFWFRIVYKNVCFFLIMYVVPLLTLVFVTVNLLATMRRRRRAAAALDKHSTAAHSRQQVRDDSVTVVLIIIIAVFIVCQTPTLVQRLLLALIDNYAQLYFYVERLADYLVLFNSCVNFAIYVVFAPHFRCILLTDVFGLRQRSRRSRRRAEQDRAAAERSNRARTGCSRMMVMNCVGGCSPAAAGALSSSESRRSGSGYCSERAECLACSPTQSPSQSSQHHHHHHHYDQQQQQQQCHQAVDDVAANGVDDQQLPLKPLLPHSPR